MLYHTISVVKINAGCARRCRASDGDTADITTCHVTSELFGSDDFVTNTPAQPRSAQSV